MCGSINTQIGSYLQRRRGVWKTKLQSQRGDKKPSFLKKRVHAGAQNRVSRGVGGGGYQIKVSSVGIILIFSGIFTIV